MKQNYYCLIIAIFFGLLFSLCIAKSAQATQTHYWLRVCNFSVSKPGSYVQTDFTNCYGGNQQGNFGYFPLPPTLLDPNTGIWYSGFTDINIILSQNPSQGNSLWVDQGLLSLDGLHAWVRRCPFVASGPYFDTNNCGPGPKGSNGGFTYFTPGVPTLQDPNGVWYNSFTDNGVVPFNNPTYNSPYVGQWLDSIDGQHYWVRLCPFDPTNGNFGTGGCIPGPSQYGGFTYFSAGPPTLNTNDNGSGSNYNAFTDNNVLLFNNPYDSNKLYAFQTLDSLDGRYYWTRVCQFNSTNGSLYSASCGPGPQAGGFTYFTPGPPSLYDPNTNIYYNAFTDNQTTLYTNPSNNQLYVAQTLTAVDSPTPTPTLPPYVPTPTSTNTPTPPPPTRRPPPPTDTPTPTPTPIPGKMPVTGYISDNWTGAAIAGYSVLVWDDTIGQGKWGISGPLGKWGVHNFVTVGDIFDVYANYPPPPPGYLDPVYLDNTASICDRPNLYYRTQSSDPAAPVTCNWHSHPNCASSGGCNFSFVPVPTPTPTPTNTPTPTPTPTNTPTPTPTPTLQPFLQVSGGDVQINW